MVWEVRSAEVELCKHRLCFPDFFVVRAPSPTSGGYIAQAPAKLPYFSWNSLKT